MRLRFIAKKSAHLPTSKLPISFLPNTAAPPRVPRYNASRAVISLRASAAGLDSPFDELSGLLDPPLSEEAGDAEKTVMPSLTRESNTALRTSANRCELSLEAEPSTPRPTLTPAWRYCLTGAIPEASR